MSLDIDNNLLLNLYNSGDGVKVVTGRVYCPKKARTCKNCHFSNFDCHSFTTDGCNVFSTVKKDGRQKPEGICIPVRDDAFSSKDNAEYVLTWIVKNLVKSKDS